jgi:hypothetical protein
MKRNRLINGLGGALMGLVLIGSAARADVYIPKEVAKQATPSLESAEDVIASMPVLSKIPKSFIIGDGFRFKLSGQELRIDHMGYNSKAPVSKRKCMVGLSIASPVAFFGSRMDIPLLFANSINSRWSANTPGDYILRFSKDASVESPTFGLSISAQF